MNHTISRKQTKKEYPNIFSINNERVCGDQQITTGLNTYLSIIGKTLTDNFNTKDEIFNLKLALNMTAYPWNVWNKYIPALSNT